MKAALILIYILTSGDLVWEELPADACRQTAAVWEKYPNGWIEHGDDFVEVAGVACVTRDAAVRMITLGAEKKEL